MATKDIGKRALLGRVRDRLPERTNLSNGQVYDALSAVLDENGSHVT